MSTNHDSGTDRRWTAAELRKLPVSQREALLQAAAALAEEEYRKNPDLRAFDAFGESDLFDQS